MANHYFGPLGKTGFVYCANCGLVGRGGGKCRGSRPAGVGSELLALRALLHDWRNDHKGFEKYYS